jgi:hypothetical protein
MQLASFRALAPVVPVKFSGVKFSAASPLEKLDAALKEILAAYERGAQRDQVLLIKVNFSDQVSREERQRLDGLKFHVFGQIATGRQEHKLVGNLPLGSLRALVQSDAVLSVEQAVGYEMYH